MNKQFCDFCDQEIRVNYPINKDACERCNVMIKVMIIPNGLFYCVPCKFWATKSPQIEKHLNTKRHKREVTYDIKEE